MKMKQLPKSALSLYVKLYCKRKGNTNTKYQNNLVEATKSWLSLCEDEKLQFASTLEDCRRKFKNRFADYLKNAEPYLKKRCNRISQPKIGEDKLSLEEFSTIQDIEKNPDIDTQIHQEDSLSELMIQHERNSHSLESSEVQREHLPEPIPPCVRSAEELFKIVKSKDENITLTWQELPQKQKNQYRMAVLALKKDYITQYKAYLESLPCKKLFEHYNNKIVP